MTFEMVRISRSKDDRGKNVYRSFAQFDGRAGTRVFADEQEMIDTLREILKSQKDAPPLLELLLQIEGGSYQFSGKTALDLTARQAKKLGWI